MFSIYPCYEHPFSTESPRIAFKKWIPSGPSTESLNQSLHQRERHEHEIQKQRQRQALDEELQFLQQIQDSSHLDSPEYTQANKGVVSLSKQLGIQPPRRPTLKSQPVPVKIHQANEYEDAVRGT